MGIGNRNGGFCGVNGGSAVIELYTAGALRCAFRIEQPEARARFQIARFKSRVYARGC